MRGNHDLIKAYLQSSKGVQLIEGWHCKRHPSGVWLVAFSWQTATNRHLFMFEVDPTLNIVREIKSDKELKKQYQLDMMILRYFGPMAFENDNGAIDALVAMQDLTDMCNEHGQNKLGETIPQLFLSRASWDMIDAAAKPLAGSARTAYDRWKLAAIDAGYDPKLTFDEMEAIKRLNIIGKQVEQYALEHDGQYPPLRQWKNFLANPFTGSSRIVRAGTATWAVGWSYDERSGRFRLVLPTGVVCRGLDSEDIEVCQ